MGTVDKLFMSLWNLALNPWSLLGEQGVARLVDDDKPPRAPEIPVGSAVSRPSDGPPLSYAPAARYSRRPIANLERMSPHERDGLLKYLFGIVDDALQRPGGRAEADLVHYQMSDDDLSGVANQIQEYFPILFDMTHVESPDEFARFVRMYFGRASERISQILDKNTSDAIRDAVTYRRESFWGPETYMRRILDKKAMRNWDGDPRVMVVGQYMTDRWNDLARLEDVRGLEKVWTDADIKRVQSIRVFGNLSFRIRARTLKIVFPHALVATMEGIDIGVDIEKHFFYRKDLDTESVDNIWDRLATISRRYHRTEGNDRHITITWNPERYVLLMEDNGAGIGNLSNSPDFISVEESLERLGWTMNIYSRLNDGTTFTIHPKSGDIITEEQFDPSLQNEGRGSVTGLADPGETSGASGVVGRSGLFLAGAHRYISVRRGHYLMPARSMRTAGFRAAGIAPAVAVSKVATAF